MNIENGKHGYFLASLAAAWLLFQIGILFYPQAPLFERTIHVGFALIAAFSSFPLIQAKPIWSKCVDALLMLGTVAVVVYYVLESGRLSERMEGIDDVLVIDRIFGLFFLVAILEAVRRVIGWILLLVLLMVLAFAVVGQWYEPWTTSNQVPELLRYDGMTLDELLESLTMTTNGLLGLTTSTSVGLVFYFVVFGAFYSAIGGGQLFIDIGLRLAGKQPGGAAKAAVVSSSLMGSISGSAVANVATTGTFTIPLMNRTGYTPTQAAGIESIASTGGQLMPPIMGIAAFVMAELLQIPYRSVVFAGIIPACAFYLSLYFIVDFGARKRGHSSIESGPKESSSLWTRAHLMIPPALLVTVLIAGWSAPIAALSGTMACFVTAYLRRLTWCGWREWGEALHTTARQAASVAVPIAAIGLIVEVSIQSNLALKFSADLMSLSGGNNLAALGLIIVGCLFMGMGLPTVAAYIIGSILFVPVLLEMGVEEIAAHMFVMYYCVLSMVTPPVALASFTAAGIARANALLTSMQAFRLSWVAFIIPLGFVYHPPLLGLGSWTEILLACVALAVAVLGWAIAIEGHWYHPIKHLYRLIIGGLALTLFAAPIGLRFFKEASLPRPLSTISGIWLFGGLLLLGCLAIATLRTPKQIKEPKVPSP